MIKAIIFDIDGVLVDSFNANAHFFRDLLNYLGYNMSLQDYKKSIFHLPMKKVIEIFSGVKSKEKLLEMWEKGKKFPYPINLFKAEDNCPEVIKDLSKNYKLGIVTSRVKKGVDDYFKFSGLEKYFPVVVTYEDYSKPKPDPEPLLVALQKLGVEPEEAVYVGDAETDFESAKGAGVGFIGFKTQLSGVKYKANTFGEIYSQILSIKN